MNEITCYMCSGNKEIVIRDNNTGKQKTIKCPVCNGKGTVQTDKKDR